MTDLFAFAEARRLREEGMARAAVHSPVFSVAAYEAIERIARRQIHVHVDDVLAECKARPSHHNAWGAVWSKAIRNGVIQRTAETRLSSDSGKHAHRYPVYFSLVFDPRSGSTQGESQ